MKRTFIAFLLFSAFGATAWAGDTHQDSQSHKVTYTITDSNGDPVSGQTVNLTVQRASDGAYLDFSTNTFLQSGWVTLNQAMSYDARGGFYWRVISIDNSNPLFSSDYVCVISNDSATYGDQQAECIEWDNTQNIVRLQH